ncbi:MAG: creatininase family protein [Candidatus Asgardarchaeia archaeon]
MILEIEKLTYIDVARFIKEGFKKVIIPVGCVEPHGPHLPLGTDTIIPYELAVEIAQSVKALVAPPVYYGIVTSLYGYTGAITVNANVFQNLIKDIILSLRQYGFEVFILLNGHGGNATALDLLLRELWTKEHIKSILINWWIYARSITMQVFNEQGAHAGIDETAMILVKHPELIKNKELINSSAYLYEDGIRVYPFPGAIILHAEKEGLPSFDDKKAEEFREKVKTMLIDKINDISKRFTEIS